MGRIKGRRWTDKAGYRGEEETQGGKGDKSKNAKQNMEKILIDGTRVWEKVIQKYYGEIK